MPFHPDANHEGLCGSGGAYHPGCPGCRALNREHTLRFGNRSHYNRNQLGRPCTFEGCSGVITVRGSRAYCSKESFDHYSTVKRIGASAAKQAWSRELIAGYRGILLGPRVKPVGLYGLLVPGGGKIGKTTRKFERRWAEYDLPFVPVLTTGYTTENHSVELTLRHMLKESGELIRGHEWPTQKGLLDSLALLEDEEELVGGVKLWMPPEMWTPPKEIWTP